MEKVTNDLAATWKRWEARFVGVGLDFNILLKLKKEITTWDEWCQKFSEYAIDREAFGDAAAERGHTLTAANAWSQAALLYHLGGMYFISDMDQFWKAHYAKLAVYEKAAPLLCPPAEKIHAEYNGVKMEGWLRKPLGVEKPPVVMLFNGFEGVKEEGEQRLGEMLDRGLATLTWDGPGRGETWKQVPMTGNHGPYASAFIDVLQKRDDINGEMIGVTGPNRGAFCAAKAAAYDQRIKCCSFASPGYDRRGTNFDDPYQLEFDKHIFHLKTNEELRERVYESDLTIEGEAQNIKCPILIIAGGRDDKAHASGSRQLYDEVQGIKQWMVFPDAERNGNNVPFKIRPIIADFLAQHLGGNVKGC